MEPTRATWTDERLDDLSHRLEGGFNRVDRDLRELRGDLGARIDELSRRIENLQRLMFQFGSGMILAIVATLVSVLATRG